MFAFCSGLILSGVTLRVWFWSLSSRATRFIPLLHHCLDDLLPALFQIVNDSLLSGSFPSVFKHALLSLFSENVFLTTTTLRAVVQSCPWVFIPVHSHWGNSSVAVLRLLEFPRIFISALPSLLIVHVTAPRQLHAKWLLTFCLLWMVVMCLS